MEVNIMKSVKIQDSHWWQTEWKDLSIGSVRVPGNRHTPGTKIRHEIVDKNSNEAIVRKVAVLGYGDKGCGKYKIIP